MRAFSFRTRRPFLLVALALAWMLPPGIPVAGAGTPPRWLTGGVLEKQLGRPIGVYWSDVPLREALYSLSRNNRVAVLLDRRVDPDQKLNLTLQDLPLANILWQVAESRGLGVCRLGPVVYLGPPRFTSRIRTLAELRRQDVRRCGAQVAARFVRSQPIQWDDFATPRQLLAQLASANGIEILGLDQVPHDLWAAADLPALPLVDQFTLIAGQFDLTFHIAADGKTITLVTVPEELAIVRSYPGGRRAEQLAEQWAALVPNSRIKVVGEEIIVQGLLEDHERITASSGPAQRPPYGPAGTPQGVTRFTVSEAKGPLGLLLEQLAARLQLKLEIDQRALEQAGISLEQQVSFSVQEATIEELFEAILAPVGCTFQRRGNTIEIRPAE